MIDPIKCKEVTVFLNENDIVVRIERGMWHPDLGWMIQKSEHQYHYKGDCTHATNSTDNTETPSIERLRQVIEQYKHHTCMVGGNFGWLTFRFVGKLQRVNPRFEYINYDKLQKLLDATDPLRAL